MTEPIKSLDSPDRRAGPAELKHAVPPKVGDIPADLVEAGVTGYEVRRFNAYQAKLFGNDRRLKRLNQIEDNVD